MSLNNYLGLLKQKFNKTGKHGFLGIFIILVIIFITIGYFSSKKTNVISNSQVTFSGYEGSGTAEISNRSQIQNSIIETAAKKVKLSDYLTNMLISYYSNSLDENDLRHNNTSSDDINKLYKAFNWINDTTVSLDKSDELKNGQIVTVSVHTEDKKSPIKESKKAFKVHGLKKVDKNN